MPRGAAHEHNGQRANSDAVLIDWAEYNRVVDDWALVVGRFMVTFTACERWTYHYILAFGGKTLRVEAESQTLRQRIQHAKKLVKRIELVDAVQTRVDASFDAMSELAVIRNIVAHNGPMPKLGNLCITQGGPSLPDLR